MIGRPVKSNVARYNNGRIVNRDRQPVEKPEAIMATVIAQRVQHSGAVVGTEKDQRYSYPIGRMRLWAINARSDSFGLSDKQFGALQQYIQDRNRARMCQGYPSEHPRSISGDCAAGSSNDISEETIVRRVRAHNAARSALLEYAGEGVIMVNAVDAAARDQGDDVYWLTQMGTIRSAANILAKHYGM